jgi:hypothetical protein
MAKTDAPVAAPPEPAMFRVMRRIKIQQGDKLVDVQPGEEIDCGPAGLDWNWQAARASCEIRQLLPLNLAAQALINPGAFRERRPPAPLVAPPAVALCRQIYPGPVHEARLCQRAAGHEGPHQ